MTTKELLSRKLIPEIKHWMSKEHIVLLIGSRQVGKTSLMRLLIQELQKDGIPEKDIIFLTLEDPQVLSICNEGVKNFLKFLETRLGLIDRRIYCFMDEIQYLEDPSGFLKLIADEHPFLKLIVSGSSTLDIRQKFKDSLAGRKIEFKVFPLDFLEFLKFKEKENLIALLKDHTVPALLASRTEPDISHLAFYMPELASLHKEFVLFGGYPAIALEPITQGKTLLLREIFNSYVRKDIKDLAQIENAQAFNNLIRILALQIGGLLNLNKTTQDIRLNRLTLERYLFLLENTFIIKALPSFSTNPKKEIIKMQKVFFDDTGLRNLAMGNFSELEARTDAGSLMENYVLTQLMKNVSHLESLHFWRTQSKSEVDFVLKKEGNELIPIEVKYQSFPLSSPPPSGLRSFIENYAPAHAVVVTKDHFSQKTHGKTTVFFIPSWMFNF